MNYDLQAVVLPVMVAVILAYIVKGWQEANFKKIKNLARNLSSMLLQGDNKFGQGSFREIVTLIQDQDKASKKNSVASEGMASLVGTIFLIHIDGWWWLFLWPFFNATSRYLFLELGYGAKMAGDALHVGERGQFDNEMGLGKTAYFILRLCIWAGSVSLICIKLFM